MKNSTPIGLVQICAQPALTRDELHLLGINKSLDVDSRRLILAIANGMLEVIIKERRAAPHLQLVPG